MRLQLNEKLSKRYMQIVNAHTEVCMDGDEFRKTGVTFFDRVLDFSKKIDRRAKELEALENQEGFVMPEMVESGEVMQKYEQIKIVLRKFNKVTEEATDIMMALYNMGKEMSSIKDRINIEKLKDAHGLKLFDKMEKKSLKLHEEYWKYKKEILEVFEEFERQEKYFEAYW